MTQPLPLIWLPGLLCDDALFEDVNKALPDWVAPSTIKLAPLPSMTELAEDVLAQAPDEFILGGLSMGEYSLLRCTDSRPIE
ncbi:beta-ketoadipate enol-lactone hydrolase [Vibrio maritimus]|uniref:Beta-ketoadipate enol-lactone hydrolase n=1 Tax=Vibrio maritimus TaxID=990268 RepID=A0A090T570_9VIBR|nr:beta-ketoadipate enol-lactone hydrolase [Vibrio maritimus]